MDDCDRSTTCPLWYGIRSATQIAITLARRTVSGIGPIDKQRTRVGEETLEHVVVGSGTPAIVLVNGSGGPIEGWHKVLTPLGELSTVFAYNRPGIGGSSKPIAPQTVEHMADTLRTLLREVGLPSPTSWLATRSVD